MSRIIVSQFVSLDGVAEDPHKWQFPFWNDTTEKFKHDELFAADALLLGRVTYESFAAVWPTRKDPFSDHINAMPKYVASTTLKDLSWNNSSLIEGDVAAAVAKLQQQPGRDILVFGSLTLVSSLIDQIDEHRLLVYPVVLGRGKRLFGEGTTATLTLAEAKPMGPDVVLLTYRRKV